MNKQIETEDMAFDLCRIDTCKHLPQADCNNTTCAHCEAEALYNAGYRKSSEVAKEIFEAIYGISIGCSVENDVMRLTFEKDPYVLVVLASEFDKLRKKYESEGGE